MGRKASNLEKKLGKKATEEYLKSQKRKPVPRKEHKVEMK